MGFWGDTATPQCPRSLVHPTVPQLTPWETLPSSVERRLKATLPKSHLLLVLGQLILLIQWLSNEEINCLLCPKEVISSETDLLLCHGKNAGSSHQEPGSAERSPPAPAEGLCVLAQC